MSIPTANEFKQLLREKPPAELVDTYLFQGIPYVYQDTPAKYETFRTRLASTLPIDSDKIFIVGSAKLGFSLNPDSFPRAFYNGSDIDVVIYDEHLFDHIWMAILNWHSRDGNTELARQEDISWAGDRKKNVYWGWFYPDRIRLGGLSFPKSLKPLRNLSASWFNAFQGLSRLRAFSSHRVSGRLYRTLGHAKFYHLRGLQLIKRHLIDPKG